MALCVNSVLRRVGLKNVGFYNTVAKPQTRIPEEPVQFFRTSENDPRNHNESHLHRFYTIKPEHVKQLFQVYGIPKRFREMTDVFSETSILVRKPALEIFNYFKQADYSKPANKYVLYGETGSGKSISLIHILHHGFLSNKLIVHVPWVTDFFQYPKEYAPSTTRPNCWNLPVDGAAWLMNFKNQNYHILENPDFKVTKTYEWGLHETTPNGAPILELINLGISRIKYSCDIIIELMNEIKTASSTGLVSTLVVIDGFDGFFSDYTRIKNDLKKFVPTNQVSVTEAFLNITQSNWHNGAIVLTVDQRSQNKRRESFYPRYLLSKEGFEHVDPFIPIRVDNYNDEEFDNTMEYFKNRKWVRDISPLGLQEIRAVCKSNPLKVREYCASL